MSALPENGLRVIFVSHQYDFTNSIYDKRPHSALFCGPTGRRTVAERSNSSKESHWERALARICTGTFFLPDRE